jgi:CHASE3 domain sensor protein
MVEKEMTKHEFVSMRVWPDARQAIIDAADPNEQISETIKRVCKTTFVTKQAIIGITEPNETTNDTIIRIAEFYRYQQNEAQKQADVEDWQRAIETKFAALSESIPVQIDSKFETFQTQIEVNLKTLLAAHALIGGQETAQIEATTIESTELHPDQHQFTDFVSNTEAEKQTGGETTPAIKWDPAWMKQPVHKSGPSAGRRPMSHDERLILVDIIEACCKAKGSVSKKIFNRTLELEPDSFADNLCTMRAIVKNVYPKNVEKIIQTARTLCPEILEKYGI